MDQNERRVYLIEYLKKEQSRYTNMQVPRNADENGVDSIAFCCISTGVFIF